MQTHRSSSLAIAGLDVHVDNLQAWPENSHGEFRLEGASPNAANSEIYHAIQGVESGFVMRILRSALRDRNV